MKSSSLNIQYSGKHQAPTSNLQAPNNTRRSILEFDVWSFSGCWMLVLGALFLELGAWNLEF
jgi:hypothetical protein